MQTSLWSLSTLLAVAFLLGATVQRALETFAQRQIVPGQKKMVWSFHAFSWLHTAIMAGSCLEYLTLRQRLDWRWSLLGLAGYIGSVVLRNAAIRTLGRFWSLHIEIRAEHVLVREGVYDFVRHPAYSAIMLEVLSIPLTVNSWWTMLFAGLTYIPMLVLRLNHEERALVEKFGGPYRQYQEEVGALVPKWSRLQRMLCRSCSIGR